MIDVVKVFEEMEYLAHNMASTIIKWRFSFNDNDFEVPKVKSKRHRHHLKSLENKFNRKCFELITDYQLIKGQNINRLDKDSITAILDYFDAINESYKFIVVIYKRLDMKRKKNLKIKRFIALMNNMQCFINAIN